MLYDEPEPLPGSLEKLYQWHQEGYHIVLISARPESSRDITIKQLRKLKIIWDQLLLGVPVGPRHLINDNKPNGLRTAWSYPVKRNVGLQDVNIL